MTKTGTPHAQKAKFNRRNVAAKSERIACTACGKPLVIRNASMAEIATCGSCGAVLNLESEDNTVLTRILDSQRPKKGLPLGSKGYLKGGHYEVIGRICQTGDGDNWTEYLLFCPTKGYLWLQEESGHWAILRKMKNKPKVNPRSVGEGRRIQHGGYTYRFYFSGKSRVTYVEGEFPYQAKVGATSEYMDAIAPPLMISAEWNSRELEWYSGSYYPLQSVCDTFHVKKSSLPAQHGVGACQPIAPTGIRKTLFWSMLVAGIVCIALMILTRGSEKKISSFSVNAKEYLVSGNPGGFISKPFTISKPCIVEVSTSAGVNNSWIFLELQLVNDKESTILAYTNELSYYSGYEGGESWSEGSNSDSTVFVVDDPGEYFFVIGGEGGSGSGLSTSPGRETVNVTVAEGFVLKRYFFIVAIFFLSFPVLELLRRHSLEESR